MLLLPWMVVGMLALSGATPAADKEKPPPPASALARPAPEGPATAELRALTKADQDDRQFTRAPTDAQWKRIQQRDRQRRARALALLKQNKLVTAEDFDAAALLFQHGETPDDYLAAHELATIAMMQGRIGSLPALSEDRFLLSIGKTQRIGTQFRDGPDGAPVFVAVEEDERYGVTDSLRRDLFVPTPAEWRRDGPKAVQTALPALAARFQERTDPGRLEEAAKRPVAGELAKLAARPTPAGVERVLALYRADALATPADYYHAALTLFGAGDRAFLLAHELALIAAVRGHLPAPLLFARTLDAYLVASGRRQRYGTMRGAGVEKKRALEVSPTMTEAVRAKLGLPPFGSGSKSGISLMFIRTRAARPYRDNPGLARRDALRASSQDSIRGRSSEESGL